MRIGIATIGGIFISARVAIPFVGMNVDLLKPFFNHPFALTNLDPAVQWTGIESLPRFFYLGCLLYVFYFLKSKKRFLTLFVGTAIFINLILFFQVGNIEHFSQRAAIEFFKSKVEEDCYVISIGYKAYAHLWYTKRPDILPKESRSFEWLMSDQADKPVYVITKIHKLKELENYKFLKEIKRKNGFVFFKKE